ncbi:MBL fold metallo-hydrolase [Paracoccus homiensis]|uniref:Glyoxylase, beta-lactamase superfamily II n=1 Tax=Paracoccus homiensis TaxID=364199 RepID=A0A1I0HWJ6_9RHOB|nr:MBL fold metallo-hydrolase [Paracoccus homiensis]SET88440.1 Glyoxylase, beta-lactamase superfamily II [Paracoccus homiensis]
MILTRRDALRSLVTVPVVAALPGAAFASPPAWQAYRGDDRDFFRAPVLLTGSDEAILIDGSFNFPSGRALVEAIRASGKRLTTIFVTVNDPDYYFSLTEVAAAFPQARVIAAPDTIALMRKKAQGKLEAWAPQLGENGPQTLDQIVFPQPFEGDHLMLEGTRIDIVTSQTMTDRRYLWVADLQAVFGGVYAFDGLHVWTADTPTPKDRANWIAELDALIARSPKVVVAGHAAGGTNNGMASLTFTRSYLLAFEEELAKATDSAALIAAMTIRFPDLGLAPALQIGAQVATGEMSWG